ncbi:unnamed protein product [Schistosoma margrebowiei]|uniref:Uncharacterized protein n=1 Tax=Schistosoma margrebowiei TaxID=48269 RepID=A0A183N447_9TREM|nr:unnamed protein product [Schistosoma margrebowiei]
MNSSKDFDFADDLSLLSRTHKRMQMKTTSVGVVSESAIIRYNFRYNTACNNPITIDGEHLEDVKIFTYLGSIIDENDGSDGDIKAWIGKARAAYLQLRNIWNSKQLSTNTKQQPTVGENKPDPSGGRNQEEALEVDRTHIEERTQLCHKASPHIESLMSKEKRKTKEHNMPGNGNRHEKNA